MAQIKVTAIFDIDESKYQDELIQQYFARMLKEKNWSVALFNNEFVVQTKEALLQLFYVDEIKGDIVIFNPDKRYLHEVQPK